MRFINALLSVQYPDETGKILEANRKAITPGLLNWMRQLAENMRRREQTEAADKLEQIIQQATAMTGEGIAVAKG